MGSFVKLRIVCCHAAGVCNDFINGRKHAVTREHNCLKQKRVLCETLYINVCHMIGHGEYKGKLVPEVQMKCIKWNFAVFFTALCSVTPPKGHFSLSRQRDSQGSLPGCSLANEKLLCVMREFSQTGGQFLLNLFSPWIRNIFVLNFFAKINNDIWAAVCLFFLLF